MIVMYTKPRRHTSSLDLVMRQMMAERSKTLSVRWSRALIFDCFQKISVSPLFFILLQGFPMIHCYGIKNRISQLSAHFKMSVGGGGLVAYRLDQLVMFIHVCINAVCDWREQLWIMNRLPVCSIFKTPFFKLSLCLHLCSIKEAEDMIWIHVHWWI